MNKKIISGICAAAMMLGTVALADGGLTSACAKNASDIAEVKDLALVVKSNSEKYGTRLYNIDQSISNLQSQTSDNSSDIAYLEYKIGTMEHAIEINSRLLGVNNLDSSSWIDKGYPEGYHSTVQYLESQVEQLQESNENAWLQINGLQKVADQFKEHERFDLDGVIWNRLLETNKTIESVNDRLNSVDTSISDLQTQIYDSNKTVSDLTDYTESFHADYNSNMDMIYADIDNLYALLTEAQAGATIGEVRDLEVQINALENRVDNIHDNTDTVCQLIIDNQNLYALCNDQQAQIANLQAQIDALSAYVYG